MRYYRYAKAHKQGGNGRYKPNGRPNSRASNGGEDRKEPQCRGPRAAGRPQRRKSKSKQAIPQETAGNSQESRQVKVGEASLLEAIDILEIRGY